MLFCGLIKGVTLKMCVLCFVLINTKIAFLWTFYVFGLIDSLIESTLIHSHSFKGHGCTDWKDTSSAVDWKDTSWTVDWKDTSSTVDWKKTAVLNEWVPLHLIEKTLINSFVLCFGICRWSKMEGKERQPLLGEGLVTLEVQNPRELKREAKYKRSEVVSLQHSYPVSWFFTSVAFPLINTKST